MELYGTKMLTTHWYHHKELVEVFGENYHQIFWKALDPDNIQERKLYDGCAEVLCNLNHGVVGEPFNLHFISHNPFAKDIREPMNEWLTSVLHTATDFELTVYHERFNKSSTMKKDPTAFGLIDDVPKNVLGAKEAGFSAYAKKHPWNKDVPVPLFDSWHELPELIEKDLTNTDKDAMIDRMELV
jgi:hypothetical protein